MLEAGSVFTKLERRPIRRRIARALRAAARKLDPQKKVSVGSGDTFIFQNFGMDFDLTPAPRALQPSVGYDPTQTAGSAAWQQSLAMNDAAPRRRSFVAI